jgi:hypothetical protein
MIISMPSHPSDRGTLGLVLALVPWLLVPFAGFFLFFGDAPPDEPDPRDRVVPWYFAITGLLALVGVVLAVIHRAGRIGRTIAAIVLGGGWVALAAWLLVLSLRR